MTITNWGQDIVGLDATQDEYTNALITLQKDIAFYNYSVGVLQNKQQWLQLFNAMSQAIITYSAAIAASDQNFQTVQSGIPAGASSDAIQKTFRDSGVAYVELLELPLTIMTFSALENWVGSTQKWLNSVAADSTGFLKGLGSAGATVFQGARFILDVPGFALKTAFAPFKILGSGVIELYDAGAEKLGWTKYDDIQSVKAVYEKLGVDATRAWRCYTPSALKQGATEFVDTLYQNNGTLVDSVKSVFSQQGSVGPGIKPVDTVPPNALEAGTSGGTVGTAAGGLKGGGEPEGTSAEPTENLSPVAEQQITAETLTKSAGTELSAATETAGSVLSKFGGLVGVGAGLLVADVVVGIIEGEVQKGEYQDAINKLNAAISNSNDAATVLMNANTSVNAAIIQMCHLFGETYEALAYFQTPVVSLTVDPSTLQNAALDAPFNLSDDQKTDLAKGTYSDPYNWSSPINPQVNPFCTTIQPYASYYAALQGALGQFSQLCNYKAELINYLNNQGTTASIPSFWQMALMFASNKGVIGVGSSQVDMRDTKNQRWLSNLFAISSNTVANALQQPANYSWFIADFASTPPAAATAAKSA